MSDPHPLLRSYGRLKSRPIKPRQAALMEARLPGLRIPPGSVDPQALMPAAHEVSWKSASAAENTWPPRRPVRPTC